MVEKKRGLGRGFDSLIPTQLVEDEFDVTAKVDAATGERTSADTLREVDPNLIDPNPHQPRTVFGEVELAELAESIRAHGILQPLVVTQAGERYELIAGERRLRASKLAGLMLVPVIVRSYDEQQKLELAIIENVQRANLNPIETATAYRKLMDQFGLSADAVGQRVGKDRSTVANTVRLLGLPLEAKRAVSDGRITEGHARVILAVPEPDKQLELLELIQRHNWTVRQAEEFARAFKGSAGTKEKAAARIAPSNELTRGLGDYLGAKVTQVATAKGGKLIIEYYSDEELDRIYRTIKPQD
ncbi:MAG TPA: ParB/RepB/Spo0J family partition protein [Candidatus Saccharimonadia bacterium]|nr:ParB/RepB/Spo0J family partition protein [Candidatus Saccharimonadia bacterium]